MTVKIIHVFCAYLTGVGFLLRGLLALKQHQSLEHKAIKTLPHIIDSCLLISGLVMVFSWIIYPSEQQWLMAKIIALLFYIGFGLLMLRWGTTMIRKWLGFIGGLMVYLYIIGVAHSKSVFSFLSFV